MTDVVLETRGLDDILKKYPDRVIDICEKAAFDIQRKAQIKTPLLTGALRNSAYTKTKKSNGFSSAVKAALGIRPEAGIVPDPDLDDSQHIVAIVGFSVEYAIYQELGTKYMAARPFLVPAFDEVRKSFMQQLRSLLEP